MASRQPPTEDPIGPSEVVGALSMADFAPLARAPLWLAFIVAAVLVAIGNTLMIRSDLVDGVPVAQAAYSAVLAAGSVLTICLPALLLWHVPRAGRTHRLLLVGLMVGAITQIARFASSAISDNSGSSLWRPAFSDVASGAVTIGIVLVGLGLLRLRADGPTRRGLLVVLAALFLVIALLPFGVWLMTEGLNVDPLLFALSSIIRPIAAAFAAWIAIDAWLDREEPRPFWALIAAALPIQVLAGLFGIGLEVPVLLAVPNDPDTLNAIAFASLIFGALLVLWAMVLAGVAYGRHTPLALEQG
jgi:hypothetical protein